MGVREIWWPVTRCSARLLFGARFWKERGSGREAAEVTWNGLMVVGLWEKLEECRDVVGIASLDNMVSNAVALHAEVGSTLLSKHPV